MDLYQIESIIKRALARTANTDLKLHGRPIKKLTCINGICVALFAEAGTLPIIEECTATNDALHIVYKNAEGEPYQIRCYEIENA